MDAMPAGEDLELVNPASELLVADGAYWVLHVKAVILHIISAVDDFDAVVDKNVFNNAVE